MSITLHHGDCLEILPTLPEASVDAVITDPPYPCIKRSYGTWTEEQWFAMMRRVVPECMRVLKPTGSAVFVLQPNSERLGKMRLWLWEFVLWVGKEYGLIQDVYWWNHTTMPGEFKGLMRPSVKFCVWVGPANCYRNQDAILWQESDTNKALRLSKRASNIREVQPSGRDISRAKVVGAAAARGGVTPFNCLPMDNGGPTNTSGAFNHGAGTPEELCRWWIRYICPPGGTVLDPFHGAGTMAVASQKEGRSCIGIERVKEYHEAALSRLGDATQSTLF